MPTNLTIIGAGGHAKVVADVVVNNGISNFSIADSSPNKVGTIIQSVDVSQLDNRTHFQIFHIAIGNNQIRTQLYDEYISRATFASVISEQAYVAESANVGEGTFIAAKAVVSAESLLGKGCIVNHGAIVEHDCKVGEFCHIAPNATLLGGVTLGHGVFVGAGATILPNVKIAADVIIGAGAVVLSDILEISTVVGAPAKRI